ncbi:hypothetical protein D3C77_250610 [compost metagenome]
MRPVAKTGRQDRPPRRRPSSPSPFNADLRAASSFAPGARPQDTPWPATSPRSPNPASRPDGPRPTPFRCPTPTPAGRNTMCWRCSPTRRATSTWATPATTSWATWWRAGSGRKASTCCIRWAGTPSACRPRTRPWSAASTPATGPGPTSRRCASNSSCWACRWTGAASSPPATPTTMASSKPGSWSCSSAAWSIARTAWSTGTRSTTPSWPMNRSSTGAAGARAPWSRSAS